MGSKILTLKYSIFCSMLLAIALLIIDALLTSSVSASEDCDKAPTYFWKAQFSSNKKQVYEYYEMAIRLCPGFIRPYELLGNLYRNDGKTEKAIMFFKRAADLGTANYKLYFLLAKLLYKKGDLDEANKNLKKSLVIRKENPKALELMEKIKMGLDGEGPSLIIFEPAMRRGLNVVHRYQNLTVRGIATDKSGVVWVRINQQDAFLDDKGNFLKDIPIQTGPNTIVIEAADDLGNVAQMSIKIEGKSFILPVTEENQRPGEIADVYNKSHAVLIGINKYEHWPALEFAVNDAKSLRKRLEMTGFDEITMILDTRATQRRILTELFHALPQKVGRNDRLLFYFAGHGHTEDLPDAGKRGYIIPVDANRLNYIASAISMEQIRSLSSRIPAKHILFVMDSCYSGLGLSRSPGMSPKISGYLAKIASMRTVQMVTAGGKGEQVREREGHGLFTAYFLRGISGEADLNSDSVVTGTELGAYLRPTVSDASQQTQTPLFGRLEGEGEFLFFVRER